MDDDAAMDGLFASFMNEVTNIKSSKMKKIEGSVGNPEEIVERLTASRYDPKQGFGSAWLVLQVSPEASESEITKQYRKLSILIHPDKCKLEKASEAFQVLVKAYQDTKDPNYNDKFKDIIGPAKERVKKAREQENKARAKKGEDPLDMEGNEFDQEVLKECDRMTSTVAETATYTDTVLAANMKRQEEAIKEAKMRKREEEKEKRQFEKGRDKRAAGWQSFVQNIDAKRFKSHHAIKVGTGDANHRREQRTEAHGKAEVDNEDKKILRSDTQAGQVGIDRTYRQAWR